MSETRGGSSGFQINRSWPPKGRARRTVLGVAAATAAAGTIMVLSAAGGSTVAGADPASVTLCHATKSVHNPYVVITVAPNSIQNRIFGPNGHATHTGPIFDPAGGKNQPPWGDIIPKFSYSSHPVIHYPGLNNTGLGSDILANGCKITLQSSTPPESTPPETTPVETTPVKTTPVKTTPVKTTPVETTPVKTTVVETTPVTSTVVTSTVVLHSGTQSSSSSVAIPVGVSAGLHTPIGNAGLKAWGVVLMILGGAAGLLAGVWPTRRRAH